ncbi:MAG: DNA topoisomerase, partial [Acidimicrobiia bacterium]
MTMKLVIVESPAKARTIGTYLGADFLVESSVGHIRDLPSKASEIPAKHRDQPWARLGVDVDNGFRPVYVVPAAKKSQVKLLRRRLTEADELYLATDEDREGESIAWHLTEVLRPKVPVRRLVFHEITPKAIRESLTATRELDRRLVDAQEARRILDRLVGYEVSPVLWRRIQRGLSAGRVQSPAVRLVVERERERMAFVTAGYWSLVATCAAADGRFTATLVTLDGQRVAGGRDFSSDGAVSSGVVVLGWV